MLLRLKVTRFYKKLEKFLYVYKKERGYFYFSFFSNSSCTTISLVVLGIYWLLCTKAKSLCECTCELVKELRAITGNEGRLAEAYAWISKGGHT